MLKSGILNPHVLSLLARVRHTNTLVIADRGFPSWPGMETIDLSLVDDVPTVLQVLSAVRSGFVIARAFMAEERFCLHDRLIQTKSLVEARLGRELLWHEHVEEREEIEVTGLNRCRGQKNNRVGLAMDFGGRDQGCGRMAEAGRSPSRHG